MTNTAAPCSYDIIKVVVVIYQLSERKWKSRCKSQVHKQNAKICSAKAIQKMLNIFSVLYL